MRTGENNLTQSSSTDAEPDQGLVSAELTGSDQPGKRGFVPGHDLHNHTILSGHADDDATVTNLIARAKELQLGCLGISEHVMRVADAGVIHEIRQQLGHTRTAGIEVLLGVEMDVDPADPDGGWVAPNVACDYVIVSAHSFPQFDLGVRESERSLPAMVQRQKLAMRWLDWYGRAIARGGMQILGHPLREPINMRLIDMADMEMREAAVAVFRPAIDHGVAFELNDAFLMYLDSVGLLEGYVQLMGQLREMGMRFARGSDSHGVAGLGACEGVTLVAETLGLQAADWLDVDELVGR